MTRVFYKDANACIIVYDVSQPRTFEIVTKWKQDVDNKVLLSDDTPVPCFLFANKMDLQPLNRTEEELDTYCREHGFVDWFATSVVKNTNIEEAMHTIVERMMQDDIHCQQSRQQQSVKDAIANGKISLESIPIQGYSKSSSSCCVGKAIRRNIHVE